MAIAENCRYSGSICVAMVKWTDLEVIVIKLHKEAFTIRNTESKSLLDEDLLYSSQGPPGLSNFTWDISLIIAVTQELLIWYGNNIKIKIWAISEPLPNNFCRDTYEYIISSFSRHRLFCPVCQLFWYAGLALWDPICALNLCWLAFWIIFRCLLSVWFRARWKPFADFYLLCNLWSCSGTNEELRVLRGRW